MSLSAGDGLFMMLVLGLTLAAFFLACGLVAIGLAWLVVHGGALVAGVVLAILLLAFALFMAWMEQEEW